MSTGLNSPTAQAPETVPLDETELRRLISAARDETYRTSETVPRSKNEGFSAKSLMDIARKKRESECVLPVQKSDQSVDFEAPADGEANIMTSASEMPIDAAILDTEDGAWDVTKLDAEATLRDSLTAEAVDDTGDVDDQDVDNVRSADPVKVDNKLAAINPDQLEHVRDEAFAEGRAAAELEAQKQLNDAIAVLEAAAAALLNPSPDVLAGLQAEITETVLCIASERAGLEIDSMPDAFVERIVTLADQIQIATNQPVLRLNPDDFAAIDNWIEGSDTLSNMRIIACDELARGDIQILVDGLRIADMITPAPPSRKGTKAPVKARPKSVEK